MSIGSWNVNDIRKDEVKSFAKKHKLDLFGLFETQIRRVNFQHCKRIFG